MEKVWKAIKQYPHYFISDNGMVKSENRAILTKNGYRYYKGKELHPLINKNNNYLYVSLINDKGKYKRVLIHRLVAEAFIPNPLNKKEVNHINGLKNDNRVKNLEWVSREENIQHAYKTGLINREKQSIARKKIMKGNEE